MMECVLKASKAMDNVRDATCIMKSTVFCDAIQCSVLDRYSTSEEPAASIFRMSSAMTVETTGSFETLISVYQTT
jgi:hypothetical protein